MRNSPHRAESCWWGLNPRPLPYQGSALPIELHPRISLLHPVASTGQGGIRTPVRLSLADLQSAPIGHSGTYP